MPEKSDELMALADVFARALLDAAREQNAEEEVAEAFGDLVGYMDRDPAFDVFLTSESVDDDPRRASLEKLFRGRLNDVLLNFLQVLNNRDRTGLVRQIHRCVVLRMEQKHRQQEVVVETAVALDDGLREQLKQQMTQRIGMEALIVEKVMPELIGGVVIHVRDTQMDGSVASRIRRLRNRLRDRAQHEIHCGRGVAVE